MNINYEMYFKENMYLSGNLADGCRIEFGPTVMSFDEAKAQAEHMLTTYDMQSVACCDGHTGELYFVATAEEEDDPDFDDWDDDDEEDAGYVDLEDLLEELFSAM